MAWRLINSAKSTLLAGAGQLERARAQRRRAQDLEFGYRMADAIAGLDIGQTIAR